MAYNFGMGNLYYPSQQPMFPQPNGNVYMIQNSLEVANVPAGAGVTAAICSSENLLYLKTVQNGVPTFLAYKLIPYTEGSKSANMETTYDSRLAAVEKQIQTIVELIKGGKQNDEQSISTKSESTWD